MLLPSISQEAQTAALDVQSTADAAATTATAARDAAEAAALAATEAGTKASGYDARRNGVIADGSTDDRAAVLAAIAVAASTAQRLVLPAGTTRNAGAVIPVPDGVHIAGWGPTTSKWTGAGFQLGSNCSVSGIGFDGATAGNANAVATRTATAPQGSRITDCRFTNYSGVAILLAATADNSGATACTVAGNTFANNGYAVLGERIYDCVIRDNDSVNAAATGRHFSFYSGTGNRFLGNSTKGGITGITGLSFGSVGGTAPLRHNIVSGNRVVGCSEEGISFDLQANSAANIGTLDWGTVVSASYNAGISQLALILDSAFNSMTAGKFYGYSLIVTTGAATGTVLPIDGSSGATIYANGTRQSVATKLAPGDEVVIGLPNYGNVIEGNYVEDAGKWAILLWGLAVGNVVARNTVRNSSTGVVADTGLPSGGIEVWGLDATVTSTGSHTGRAGRAPSVLNRVEGNILHRGDLRFGVKAYSGAGFTQSASNTQSGNVVMNGDIVT